MATAMKTNNQTTTTVNMAPLLFILSRLKKDANQNLGENEKLKGELNSKIDKIIRGTDVITTTENVNELAGIISKSSELRNDSGIGVMAKRIELEAKKLIERYPKEIEELRKKDFEENFDKELVERNPNLDQTQLKDAREYRDLVAKDSFKESVIDGQQNEALEVNKEFGSGKLANAWTDCKTTMNVLQKSPEEFKKIKETYNSLKGKLDGVNLPTGSKEARSFERVMSVLNNPNADDLFSKTRKYLGWADRVDKLTGGWLNKTVTDAGVKVFEKIGNQAIQEFTTNALGQMAEHGFQQGFSNVLNGILSGGVQATATTTASGVGTGVAVGGTAAATTSGTVAVGAAGAAGVAGTAAATGAGAAAGGVAVVGGAAVSATGIGAIVVAAVAVLGAAKKIGDTIVEKLGISSKKFLEENFGKVGGFFIKTATMMVAVPAAIIGAITATTVGPIIIAVIIGLFGYQMFQSGLVSSLVPPKGATSTTSTTVDIPVAAGENNDITNIPETSATCVYGPITLPTFSLANVSRPDLIRVAYSLVGKVHYWFGGTYYQFGADPTWGQYKYDKHSLNKPKGLDCSGFVTWAYYQVTGRQISGNTSDMNFRAHSGEWQIIDKNNLKIGDIGFRRRPSGAQHVGIYIGENSKGENLFVHAGDTDGCILVNTVSYAPFQEFYRPNVKFSDD